MSDYQRIVSYLYEYNHGIKGSNVGFARIEKRQQQLKVYFHVKTNERALPYKIYFYRFHEGTMEGILLDTFQKNDVVIEMKHTYPLITDLDQVDGFLIYHSNQLFFGSEWNDKTISIRNFLPLEETNPTEPEPEPLSEPEPESLSEPEPVPESLSDPEPAPESSPAKDNATSKLVEYIEALQLEKNAKEKDHKIEPKDLDWKEYPSLSLPFDSVFDPCVKVALDDLKTLPRVPEKLPSNGFLLLNYGNYGHLMLAKHKATSQIYLGVPGTFDNEKNFIAKFFGFEDFITVPEKKQKTGNFGYWMIPI